MKLHYNPAINERKDIAKNWAEKTNADAIFNRRENVWEVGAVMFHKDGIIEGTLTCQQVDELTYLLRDWEFADQDSKDEYMKQREAADTVTVDSDYVIPNDIIPAISAEETDPTEQNESTDPFGYTVFDRIERPAGGFDTPEAWAKLGNLIASHKTLIMKSIGVRNLDFHEEMDSDGKPIVAFYWLPKGTPGDLFMAALEMISHLCRKALELRNVDPTEYPAADEQFEFSRFLHRIGMVGAAYKKHRKILMQNLSGSTWRKAVEERTARRALEDLQKGA